jgi:hypothetical protein
MVPMNRLLGKKLFSSALAVITAASLAACGGGAHSASLPPSAPVSSTAPAPYTGPLADATFKITIPGPKNSAFKRRPEYVSSATKSVKFTINTASKLTAGQITAYNALSSFNHFDTGTLPNATCPASGADFVCTVPIKLPPGTDNITITAYDNTGGTGNILSQQIATFTVVAATANSFNIVLDAQITTPSGSLIVNGSGACQNGPVGASYGAVGTSAVSFTVAYTDAAGKTIPSGVVGQPKLQIQDNGGVWQSAGGTINATGGTVTFSITQSSQTYTLTPSTVPISNATINVRAIAPNSTGSSDGLTYTVAQSTKTYTFSAGTAPPSHNFLAVVEQTGVGSGKVDFFNLTTDAGGPNGWATGGAVFSPASLAVTQSTNDNTQNDVDNPVSLAWDTTGDLLVGNGGSSGNGNLACVPVGAISTGANSSTTVTANVHDPVGLAYEPRNGTVAIGNNANTGGAAPLAEYTLTGNYTASTTAGPTNLHSFNGSIGGDVVNMPSLATGTFAATLTDDCEVDSAHKSCGATTGTSQVVIFNGGGVTTTMTDTSTFHIDEPWGITWDNTNGQLIVANTSAWHPSVVFYTTAGAFVKTDGHDYFGASQNPYLVAANGAGLFAVAYTTAIAGDEVQIYTNAGGGAAPVPLFNPIPFDAENNNSCSGGYVYGSSAIVSSITWLSNTRLLVGLETSTASANGYYIYDTASSTTPAQWDFGNGASCNAVGAIPAQKAFQQITNKPLAAAFKP